MGKGIPIGLKDLYYAILQDDPAAGGTPSYEAPVKIAGAITANVNPNASNETLFADDGPYETASTIGQITLELNVADLPLAAQAVLLGHEKVGGVLKRKAGDIPPWVAIGFRSLKSNGSYRYTWLNKGKFSLPEQANETKGDSVNFQTPTITGAFVKRDCDDEWERHTDEDDIDYVASIGANWFTDPVGTADTTPPEVSSTIPAADATGVAVNSSITINFNEALMASSVTRDNIFIMKDLDGAKVAGALAIDAARKQVTFTPTANLTAATAYRLIITTNVKDIYGNKLVTPYVSTFTTA